MFPTEEIRVGNTTSITVGGMSDAYTHFDKIKVTILLYQKYVVRFANIYRNNLRFAQLLGSGNASRRWANAAVKPIVSNVSVLSSDILGEKKIVHLLLLFISNLYLIL